MITVHAGCGEVAGPLEPLGAQQFLLVQREQWIAVEVRDRRHCCHEVRRLHERAASGVVEPGVMLVEVKRVRVDPAARGYELRLLGGAHGPRDRPAYSLRLQSQLQANVAETKDEELRPHDATKIFRIPFFTARVCFSLRESRVPHTEDTLISHHR